MVFPNGATAESTVGFTVYKEKLKGPTKHCRLLRTGAYAKCTLWQECKDS